MSWILRRTLFVATTLLMFYTAPLCVLASDGRENPYDVVVSFRLELILTLLVIMTAWWAAWMLNCVVSRPITARELGGTVT